MALVKVIEIMTESAHSWEDAARVAVAEASATLRNIRSIYVKDFEAKVEDDAIVRYRITAKISFVVEGTEPEEAG